MSQLLDRERIEELLRELGRKLETRGVQGRLFVVGGAAMALAYGRARATQDVDAVFEPKEVVYEAARELARERGLSTDWLNDGLKSFLVGADPNASTHLDEPGLRVEVASPRYLFVLKAMAARVDRDARDLVDLFRICGFRDVDVALEHVDKHAPSSLLQPKTEFLLRELLADEE
jgi:predicted nucleotidyltransferase